MSGSRRWVAAAAAVVLVASTAGCSGNREDPILRLSAQEALEIGKELMERKKYFQAREHLTHAFEVEPNSASGREALLLVADTHFLEGGSQNFIKAEAKYRDFQNRFPTSERGAYVQYQIASSLAKRMRRPDRDQTITREALEAYEDLIRLYPSNDEYVAEAQTQIELIRGRLAESEYLVGRYNYRRGRFVKCGSVCYRAAIARLDNLLETYPGYQEKAKVYYLLTLSALGSGLREKADGYREMLREHDTEGKFLKSVEKQYRKVDRKIDRIKKKR